MINLLSFLDELVVDLVVVQEEIVEPLKQILHFGDKCGLPEDTKFYFF